LIRTPLAPVPWLFAIVAVAAGLLWHAGDRIATIGQPVVTGTASVGGPFRLIDENGSPRSDADFRGRFMLVYFGYSLCPDVCPTTLAVMADALAKLGPRRSHVVPVFITLDPERDNPRVLKNYLQSFGTDFVGLTGKPDTIRDVAATYRVYYSKHPLANGGYAIDHTSVLYLMGPDGKFVTYYDDETIGPNGLAEDLKKRV
jgi:cytochrome oxidase Cu insertion factor (SCO1/SenC/PrrC family)